MIHLNTSRSAVHLLAIKCATVSCPESVGIGVTTGRKAEGLTLRALEAELSREGWGFGARTAVTSQGSMQALLPLCPTCVRAVEEAQAMAIVPATLPFPTRQLATLVLGPK